MENEDKEDFKRAKVLLKAMCDMMKKQDNSRYVLNIFETTAVWDNAECDGYCLYEEAKELIGYED